MRLWTAESGFESLPPNQTPETVQLHLSAIPMRDRRSVALTARWLCWLTWVAVAAAAVVRFAGSAADDVYITYRYAQNFALGRGLVFNPGQRVFGETEPGLALLLGGLHAVTRVPIPWLGALLCAASLLGIAALLLHEGERAGSVAAAAIGGTLVVGSGFLWDSQGAAAPIVVCLLLLAARWAESRPAAAAACCAAAVWARPDALAGAGLLGLLLWFERRRFPWRLALVTAVLVGAGAALELAYYGAVVPNTLLAKQLHAARNPGSWIGFEVFWDAGVRWFAPTWGDSATTVLALGAVGAPLLWRRFGRGGRLLLLNGLALLIAYPALRVPFFPWYGIPVLVPILYGLGLLLVEFWRNARALGGVRWRVAAVAVAAVAAFAFASIGAGTWGWWQAGPAVNWRLTVYRDAGLWLGEHAKPDEAIAFPEIGILAYYSDRRVEDILGLVTPRSLPFAREGDVVGAFLALPTEFMLEHSFVGQGAFTPITRRDWFAAAYEPVQRFHYADGSSVLYRRRAGAVLPAPRAPRPRVLPPSG